MNQNNELESIKNLYLIQMFVFSEIGDQIKRKSSIRGQVFDGLNKITIGIYNQLLDRIMMDRTKELELKISKLKSQIGEMVEEISFKCKREDMLLSKIESLKNEIDSLNATQNIVKKKIEIDYRRLQIVEALFNRNASSTVQGLKSINIEHERLRNHTKPKRVVPKALEAYYKEQEKEIMLDISLFQLERAFKIEPQKIDIQLDVGYESLKKPIIKSQDAHSQKYLDEIDEKYIQKFKEISTQCDELDFISPIKLCYENDLGKDFCNDPQLSETLRSISYTKMQSLENNIPKDQINVNEINQKESITQSILN